MSQLLDRRPDGRNKSAVNRQRFLHRFKDQIKNAVNEAAAKRSITNINAGEKIKIPTKDTYEPRVRFGKGGSWEVVNAGNKEFVAGDHVKREIEEGGGSGDQASDAGSGNDEFTFDISREEFLNLFFEDLALPNLIKKQLTQIPSFRMAKAGYVSYGSPTNISIVRSLRNAHARRIAFTSSLNTELSLLEDELKKLTDKEPESPAVAKLKQQIADLETRRQKLPFIDPFDIRYHSKVKIPSPTTQAVMFCVMDVSGSMDEAKKNIAKRFFILLYLFLTHNYEKIDLVFIRHHTVAKEVDEQEFFYSRETGGTVVSSALEMVREVIRSRYSPDLWNIYVAQASDGDNWSADSPYCREILQHQIMPLVQYFAYVEVMPRYHQSLWEAYLPVQEQFANFAMQTINELPDIYPVFRELFKKQVLT